MTSPKKNLDLERESTFFGELEKVEIYTKTLTAELNQEIVVLRNLTIEFHAVEKEGKQAFDEAKAKSTAEISQFESRIKNYITSQKAEYSRVANQINSLIMNSKEINSQLIALSNRFQEFQKNVGI